MESLLMAVFNEEAPLSRKDRHLLSALVLGLAGEVVGTQVITHQRPGWAMYVLLFLALLSAVRLFYSSEQRVRVVGFVLGIGLLFNALLPLLWR